MKYWFELVFTNSKCCLLIICKTNLWGKGWRLKSDTKTQMVLYCENAVVRVAVQCCSLALLVRHSSRCQGLAVCSSVNKPCSLALRPFWLVSLIVRTGHCALSLALSPPPPPLWGGETLSGYMVFGDRHISWLAPQQKPEKRPGTGKTQY